MAGFIVGIILQSAAELLLEAIKDVLSKSKEFKPLLQQLKSTVDRITPIFEEIESLNQAVHRPAMETKFLGEQLDEAKDLVLKCDGAPWWNECSYAKKLIEYDRSLTRFFQIDVMAQILHSVRRVEKFLVEKYPAEYPSGEEEKFLVEKYPAEYPSGKEEEYTSGGFLVEKYPAEYPAGEEEEYPAGEEEKEEGKEEEEGAAPEVQLKAEEIRVRDPLDFLRNSPQFQALRPLLQKNPRLLELTLQGLEEKHPDIFGRIKKHEAEFRKFIDEPVDGSDGFM